MIPSSWQAALILGGPWLALGIAVLLAVAFPLSAPVAWARWVAFHTWRGLKTMAFFAVAVPLVVCLSAGALPWHARRHRASRAERHARKVLGVAAAHPERVVGSDRAAEKGDFPLWAAELEADGIDAGQIISAYRRGL